MALRVFESAFAMWTLSFSARSKYSSTFFLMRTRSFSFFSSVDTCCRRGSARRVACQHQRRAIRTFKSHHEVVESILILFICFGIVLVDVLIYCLLDNFDCSLMVYGLCCRRKSAKSVVAEGGQLTGYLHRENCRLTSLAAVVVMDFELKGIGTKLLL